MHTQSIADRAVARGLASLHHQEAHKAPYAPYGPDQTFEDEPPEADQQIARLHRALAAQSQRTDWQAARITESETRTADAIRELTHRVEQLERDIDALLRRIDNGT